MEVLEILKNLILIPSFVDNESNENELGEYIYTTLRKISYLTVKKQYVSKNRFNIIATDSYPTKLLWCGHIDTIQLQNGWKTNPLEPTIIEDNMYGLGASDMKGSIAALIETLYTLPETKGLMLLFYVDEEYDFAGIKKFSKLYKSKIKPKYIFSGDGKNLAIGNACRGLIELNFIVRGKTGHSSRPNEGNNVIIKSVLALENFTKYINKNYSKRTLTSVCNVSFLQGGLDLRKKDKIMKLGREGNSIPNVAEFVLEIRPASPNLNAQTTISLLKQMLSANNIAIESLKIRHDIGGWFTEQKNLKIFYQFISSVIPITFLDPQKYGYIDLQILWNDFKKIPCFTFGPGNETGHKPNEYINISTLRKMVKIYANIIKSIEKL